MCAGRNVLKSQRLVRRTVNCSNDLAAGIALDKPVRTADSNSLALDQNSSVPASPLVCLCLSLAGGSPT